MSALYIHSHQERNELPYSDAEERIAKQKRRIDTDYADGLEVNNNDLKKLHLILDRLQRQVAKKGIRLHLLYEHETLDPSARFESNRTKIDTRVLFSPTICLATSIRKSTFTQISDCLHVFSLASRQEATPDDATLPQSQQQPHKHLPPQHSNAGAVAAVRNLANVGIQYALSNNSPELCIPSSIHIRFPKWFTGKRTDSKASTTTLSVSPYIFSFLDSISIGIAEWLYRTFFRVLHAQARCHPTLRPFVHTSLQYAIFIPPWMPKTLRAGSHPPQYIGEYTLPDIRHQKTTTGRKRLLLILTAFWQYEKDMSELLLRFLRENYERLHEKHIFKSANKPADLRRAKRLRPEPDPSGTFVDEQEQIDVARASPQHLPHQTDSHQAVPDVTISNATPVLHQPLPVTSDGHKIFAVLNNVSIVCCAGTACRLQDNEGAQAVAGENGSDGFSSKCSSCQNPMHHMCGSGDEMGSRICPSCQ